MPPTKVSSNAVPTGWADWFSPGRFALLLGLLVMAAFPHVLLGGQTFVIRDYGMFAYPLAYFQRVNFWHGQLPLWNPYNNCGVPFLAQWNTMPLYPPALIYLLLPLTWGLNFFCLLHLWFAGVGMYRLARRWTGSPFAAAFAGLAFAFNGFTLNLLMWPSHIATFAWMPWVVLAVERAWQDGGRKMPIAALVGALQMLAGGPETILFTWLLLLALWVAQWITAYRSGQQAFRIAWRLPVVVLLVAGLAAVQLLPFMDLAAHSQREQGYADTRWSTPATGWANFLVPLAFETKWGLGIYFQSGQGWTSSYYLGVGTLLLALLALVMRFGKSGAKTGALENRTVWLLIGIAAMVFLFSFGDQLIINRAVRRLIPQLSFITYPVKYLTLVIFIAPLLAAVALARMSDGIEAAGNRRRLTVLGAVLLGLIAVILIWAGQASPASADVLATLLNGLVRAAFLLVAIGLLFALLRAGSPPWGRWVPLMFLFTAWLDILTHVPTQNPAVAPWVFQPGLVHEQLAMNPQPALGGSRAMVLPSTEMHFTQWVLQPKENFLVKRVGYFANCNLLDDVPKVNGFFSLYPREGGELTTMLYTSSDALSPGLLDFMGVSQITVPGEAVKWQPRTTCQPLVTAGQKPVFASDETAVRAMIGPDFDPSRTVYLPEKAQASVAVSNATSVRVISSHFANERVEAEVEAVEPSLVVVAQTYYHSWHAYVDGAQVPLLRANYAFQAVPVPTGHHQIKLVYEDRAFQVGVVISLLTLVGCGVGLRRRSP